ncbi:DMT family transporter [Enterovibrio sp. ZSDZ35]|uniref:DMT family transporter n=1 Tax=Enterovibrio qingdaonensis TaxID=2899818 RepID=A0ABT5QLP4_9GAMM|nr:DMT family transporter [Enterovibrio sp. ZSDZ35]MDD1781902.1 DMT family transporter [Enterovibrio sp. ZSDZ35]
MKAFFHSLDAMRQGSIAILFASVLWGTTGTVASFAPNISPLAIGAFSMGVAGLLLGLFFRRHIRNDWRKLTQRPVLLAIGAFSLAIYPLAFYTSMRLAGVAVGTVISIASAPFFAVIIEKTFGNAPALTTRWVLSAIVGTIGIALLAVSETSHGKDTVQNASLLLGISLGLVAALAYTLYAWVAKQLIQHDVNAKSAMGSIFLLGALLLLPSLYFTGQHLFSTVTNALVVSYMALIPMFLGYVCFGFGLSFVNTSKATLLTLFEPVVAAILAVVIVGELISPFGWLGMAMISFCLLVQASEKQTLAQ